MNIYSALPFSLLGLGFPELAIVLVYALLIVIPFWRISIKAGHPGWYSLVALIPILNVVALYLFAFTRWPIERQ